MPSPQKDLRYIDTLISNVWNEAGKDNPITQHTIKAIAYEVARREFAEGCRMAINHERNK